LFIGYRLADAPAARVAAIAASVRGKLPKGSWVAANSYHLTFAFLGEQRREVVPALVEALGMAVASRAAVDARLASGGFFPNERHPRAGWIGVEPRGAIEAIAPPLREALASCGVSFDTKEFKAHLTLVRLRDSWSRPAVEAFLGAVAAAGEIPFRLDRVSLFESRLLPSGAVHDEIAALPLG
jgi:2'-5' RNA ligase